MTSILPKKYLAKGFKVFVTIPGVVTSKVSFLADPTFQGEHNFFIHGIHAVKVGSSPLVNAPNYLVRCIIQKR